MTEDEKIIYWKKSIPEVGDFYEEVRKLANAGDVENMWKWGDLLSGSGGAIRDMQKEETFISGIEWLRKAGEKGSTKAMNTIARIYLSIAEEYYELSAEKGNLGGYIGLIELADRKLDRDRLILDAEKIASKATFNEVIDFAGTLKKYDLEKALFWFQKADSMSNDNNICKYEITIIKYLMEYRSSKDVTSLKNAVISIISSIACIEISEIKDNSEIVVDEGEFFPEMESAFGIEFSDEEQDLEGIKVEDFVNLVASKLKN